jgi:hypothetical protein
MIAFPDAHRIAFPDAHRDVHGVAPIRYGC